MKTFLSIDLDYFNSTSVSYTLSFFRRLKSFPFFCTVYHDQFITKVNELNPDVIINVDYHDDLAFMKGIVGNESYLDVHKKLKNLKLMEGTWLGCINNTKNKELIWYTKTVAKGRCDDLYDCWNTALLYRKQSIIIEDLPEIDFSSVDCIGVTISPNYTYKHIINTFYQEFNIEKPSYKRKLDFTYIRLPE